MDKDSHRMHFILVIAAGGVLPVILVIAAVKSFPAGKRKKKENEEGSEYENVVLCIARGGSGPEFLNRNMIYTAATRAVKKLILLGSLKAFAAAAATPALVRKTALSVWLRKERKRNER